MSYHKHYGILFLYILNIMNLFVAVCLTVSRIVWTKIINIYISWELSFGYAISYWSSIEINFFKMSIIDFYKD